MKENIGRLSTVRENKVGQMELVKQEKFAGLDVDLYKGENGEVYMTIDQLAQALEYASKSAIENMLTRNEYLKYGEFSSTHDVWVDEKARNTRLFTEDGIYEITMLSKQPKAKEFRFFIRELLKGLRKGELQIKTTPQTYVEALRALADAEEEKEKLSQEVVGLNHTIGLMQPKIKYLDTILTSTDALNVTQIAKDYGLSGRKLNELLNEERIQYKTGGQWVLYQNHAGEGYTKTYTHSYDKTDGSMGTNLQTKWTQKGRLLIHNILVTKGYIAEMDKMEEEEAE